MNPYDAARNALPEPYYADDAVALYHMDCREGLALMADATVDMVLTDPPYGNNQNTNGDLAHVWERALGIRDVREDDARPIHNDGEEATQLVEVMLHEAKRLLVPGAVCAMFCSTGGPQPRFAEWSRLMDEVIGFKQMLVWDKRTLGMGWHYRRSYEFIIVGEKPGAACKWYGGHDVSNVIRDITGLKPNAQTHPTPKPLELIKRLMTYHTEPGDLVLEPFSGGGTTLRAAKDLGRHCIGFETDEQWLDMTVRRLGQEVLL